MGKDEREDAPQPSDSTPFTDIQPPRAMTANDSSRPLRADIVEKVSARLM
jgi:hypothetical protein